MGDDFISYFTRFDAGEPIMQEKVERDIIAKRYYQPGETSWAQLADRIATHVATAEVRFGGSAGDESYWRDRFAQALYSQTIVASSPIIFNAGTPCEMLSACTGTVFAEDKIEAILQSVTECATLTADGAGVGYNITPLRYRDAPLSRKGVASGACSWLKMMDSVGQTVRQGGRNRRAAMLATLHIDHPDAVEFCFIKDDTSKLTHMNISLGITDEFMRKVEQDEWHEFQFPVGSGKTVTLHIEPTDMDAKPDPRFAIFLDALKTGNAYGAADGPVDEAGGLVGEPTKLEIGAVKARWLFDLICAHAHQSGEPGLLFLDAHARQNPIHDKAPITTTNPCGEIGLNEVECKDLGLPEFEANGVLSKAHDSCNLAHIVVPRMVTRAADPLSGRWWFEIDWDKLAEHVALVTRFLDNVIELSEYRPSKIGAANRAIRKTGLGIIGFADLCIMLGIKYGSEDSILLAHELASFIEYHALLASHELSKERGSFGFFEGSKYQTEGLAFRQFPTSVANSAITAAMWADLDAKVRTGLRNAMVTMLAPTGSTALLVGNLSNSLEPIFFKEQRRRTVDAVEIVQRHWLYEEFVRGNLPSYVTEDLFIEAFDLTPEQHVEMQLAFQQWIGMSISKTINLPHTASVDDVRDAYLRAYHGGAKGITVYRDGSRGFQPVSNANVKMDETGKLHLDAPAPTRALDPMDPAYTEGPSDLAQFLSFGVRLNGEEFPGMVLGVDPVVEATLTVVPEDPRAPHFSEVIVPRPEVVQGATAKVEFGGEKLYVTLNRSDNGQPVEVLVTRGKAGSDAFAEGEALGRLISVALKHGTRLSDIIKQLRGIGGETVGFFRGRRYGSLADAVGTTLAELVGWAKPKTAADAEAFADQYLRIQVTGPTDPATVTAAIAKAVEAKALWTTPPKYPPSDAAANGFPGAVVEPPFAATTEGFSMGLSANHALKCPECKAQNYYMASGCGICQSCGYSRCK